MDDIEIIIAITGLILNLIIICISVRALSIWKTEIKGRDKYKLSKSLLEYLQDISFLIYDKDSIHKIYLNDILDDRKMFFKEHLKYVGDKKIYFGESVFYLFDHLKLRSDIFITQELRKSLEKINPNMFKFVNIDKEKSTYIEIIGIDTKKLSKVTFVDDKYKDGIYTSAIYDNLTIKDYFSLWEKVIKELLKDVR
jgi:hypothetical protein